MSIRKLFFSTILSLFFVSISWAAEISVAPGSGTLATAVASAADGDTLMLQDGGFYGAVTVNKSLTIRPVTRETNALVGGVMTINGSGIKVTVQGLKLSVDVKLEQAAAVRLLENEWLSGDIEGSLYKSSDGDGSLVVVGNRLNSGSIKAIYSDGAYIAGNVLLNGYIETIAYAWIVGNEVYRAGINTSISLIITSGAGATAFILANRVHGSNLYGIAGINAAASSNLIAGNIVEVEHTSTSNNAQQNGILANGSGHVTVINNVIRGLPLTTNRIGSAIAVTAPSARVAGNIVIDYVSGWNTPIYVTSSIADVAHNLCFNSSIACPPGNDNLDGDPMFVDLVDYELTPGSPAIDAGPPDLGMADLDRTRNDMGIHGGPWSIGQYDAQRDPGNYAPYVYPLFNMDSILSGGILEIRALGVARLR